MRGYPIRYYSYATRGTDPARGRFQPRRKPGTGRMRGKLPTRRRAG